MNALRTQILEAAIPMIVFDGWTMGTLDRAAESIGRSSFDVTRTFPAGVVDAVNAYSARADARMIETLRREYQLSTMKIRERIATAVMVRLRQQLAEREAMRRTIGFYALPWNAGAALNAMYATVDAIWHEAGDTATDYNFYTKRLMLAGVLKSTTAVWLDDTSENLADTESFLRRRIENVMQIEKGKARLRDTLGKLESWLPGSLRSKA